MIFLSFFLSILSIMCKPLKYNENPYNVLQFNRLCKGFVYSGEIAEILKIDSETLLKN
jgi:hypothetical protein